MLFVPFCGSIGLHMRRLIPLQVAVAFLLLAGTRSPALDSNRSLKEFGHQAWLTENGLPQNTVQSIIQTRDGYLWIGTQEGLARFDGLNFTVFDKENTPAFKSNDIRFLYEDLRGGSGSAPLTASFAVTTGSLQVSLKTKVYPTTVLDQLSKIRAVTCGSGPLAV